MNPPIAPRITAADDFKGNFRGNLGEMAEKGLTDQWLTSQFESNPGSHFIYLSCACRIFLIHILGSILPLQRPTQDEHPKR
jgi:hypothetical protein